LKASSSGTATGVTQAGAGAILKETSFDFDGGFCARERLQIAAIATPTIRTDPGFIEGHIAGFVRLVTLVMLTREIEVIWADSKRFAFNYGPPTAPHTTYVTTAFYQLRGEEWVLLHSPIDQESSSKSFAQLAKHLPKRRPPTASLACRPPPGRLQGA
jgi:hypothetical protein